jgi:integrase
MRFPQHLVKNALGQYYVRLYVPKDLKQIMKKTEIRRSLQTTCSATAQQRSIAYIQAFQEQLLKLRGRCGMAKKDDGIMTLEMIRVEKMRRLFPDGREEILENVEIEGEAEDKFLLGGFSKGVNGSESMICSNGEIWPVPLETEQQLPPQPVLQVEPLPESITADRPLFSQVVERLLLEKKEHRGEHRCKTKTLDNYRYIEKLFVGLYTDRAIDSYDIRIAYDFRKVLQLLPLRVTRSKPWRDMEIKEILNDERLEESPRLAPKRVSDLLKAIGAIFNSALKHKKVQASIFTNIDVDYTVTSYSMFTVKDLCEIFGKELPVDRKMPSHYWVPLIGLYTGMRRSEIFFRTVRDIKHDEDGIWFFDVHRDGESDTKNKKSVRKVPIHSKLIDLGLLKYVEKLKLAYGDNARLFSEYVDHGGQAGVKFSDYFATYLESIGLVEKTKVFHSFRTTFINALEARSVYTPRLQRIIGQATGTIVHDTYGGQSEMQVFSTEIEKLNFDRVLLALPRWPF